RRAAGAGRARRPAAGPRARTTRPCTATALLLFPQVPDDGFERVDDLVAADAALREVQLQVERFGRGPVGEHVVLRPAGLRLRGRLAELLAGGAALAGDLLDEGGHFLRGFLPNHLQQQRLGGNVGQPTQVPDLLGDAVQRQRFGDRGARLAEAPRQVLVRVAAAVGQPVERLRLFERRQVLALQVLDQRELDDLRVVDLADDRRHVVQADLDRRLVPAL